MIYRVVPRSSRLQPLLPSEFSVTVVAALAAVVAAFAAAFAAIISAALLSGTRPFASFSRRLLSKRAALLSVDASHAALQDARGLHR